MNFKTSFPEDRKFKSKDYTKKEWESMCKMFDLNPVDTKEFEITHAGLQTATNNEPQDHKGGDMIIEEDYNNAVNGSTKLN